MAGSHVPAAWQASRGAQALAAPATHAPALHESAWVQAFPSVQAAPSGCVGFEQTPVAGLHVPAVWHVSRGAQGFTAPPVQTPALHESAWVQAFPSVQAEPSGCVGFEQAPVAGSHVPAAWQASRGAQGFTAPPAQTPALHESAWVQAFPSVHAAPSGCVGFEQAPVTGLHVPAVWHASRGAQAFAGPATQRPCWQVSPVVQPLPSSQAVPSGPHGTSGPPVTPNDPSPATRLTKPHTTPSAAGVYVSDSATPTPAFVLEATITGLPFASGFDA